MSGEPAASPEIVHTERPRPASVFPRNNHRRSASAAGGGGGMRRLKRLAALTNCQRLLLLRVLFIVAVTRLSLWLLPIAISRKVVMSASGLRCKTSVDQCIWAVKIVSRCVPRATCLTQAIAAQALLARAGRESH